MDAAQLKQEFEKANAKLDRLEALRRGATEEEYQGEKDELAQEEIYWMELKKTLLLSALVGANTQPGNDFVTRALGT